MAPTNLSGSIYVYKSKEFILIWWMYDQNNEFTDSVYTGIETLYELDRCHYLKVLYNA